MPRDLYDPTARCWRGVWGAAPDIRSRRRSCATANATRGWRPNYRLAADAGRRAFSHGQPARQTEGRYGTCVTELVDGYGQSVAWSKHAHVHWYAQRRATDHEWKWLQRDLPDRRGVPGSRHYRPSASSRLRDAVGRGVAAAAIERCWLHRCWRTGGGGNLGAGCLHAPAIGFRESVRATRASYVRRDPHRQRYCRWDGRPWSICS